MAKKFILANGAFKNVSDDTIPAIRKVFTNKPVGSMLFGLSGIQGLLAQGDQQNSVAAICQTDAEVTASKAANQVSNGFVVDVRGSIWVWNGAVWAQLTLTPTALKNYLRPRRMYYNTQSLVLWYVASDMGLIAFAKKDNPFASQTDVTNGAGSGLVSPATLKNAYGSW